MVQGLVDRLKHRPWLALLIDGIGATLSAFSLGVVLPALEPYVGMPRRVLFVLALVALVYAACSIGSYCLRRNEWGVVARHQQAQPSLLRRDGRARGCVLDTTDVRWCRTSSSSFSSSAPLSW